LPRTTAANAERAPLQKSKMEQVTLITPPSWPNAGWAGNAKFYSTADRQNNAFALANAMHAAGAQVYLARNANDTPSCIFAAHPHLAANAAKFHLQLQSRSDLPQGAVQLKSPRIAIYKPYVPAIDEGWTRFVLEQYGFNVKNIENKEIKAGNLNSAYDVIILPDSSKDAIVEGKSRGEGSYSEALPPEFTGGIGKEGVRALHDFVDKGGTLIALANASDVIIGEEFNLPLRNSLASPHDRPA